jgi:hypothetical protein
LTHSIPRIGDVGDDPSDQYAYSIIKEELQTVRAEVEAKIEKLELAPDIHVGESSWFDAC